MQTTLHYTPENIRERLRSIMAEKNLVQFDVANETGLNQSQLSYFLRGKRELNGKSILKLLEFCIKHQDTQHATETR